MILDLIAYICIGHMIAKYYFERKYYNSILDFVDTVWSGRDAVYESIIGQQAQVIEKQASIIEYYQETIHD
jgi:hypothetical protein